MTLSSTLKGIYFVFTCFISSYFGSCFVMLPSLPLAVCLPSLYRSYVQFMIGTWMLLPPSLYEIVFGTKIVVTGDQLERKESSLIIANHRTRLDWMFLWSVTGRARVSALLKIILRGDLKHIPGFGWSMQFGSFLFLSRKWAKDKQYLTDKISFLAKSDDNYKLLVFPEGTDYDPKTKAKSDKFGEKEGWPHLDFLLHPRSTGFVHCVNEYRKGKLDAIYDLTMGYPKTLPHRGEMDLITGRFPEEIHTNVKRYEASEVPSDDVALEAWLRERWYEKEKLLKNFYETGEFPVAEGQRRPYFSDSANTFKWPIFVIWNAALALSLYLLIISPATRSYFLFANLTLFLLSTTGLLEDLDRRCEKSSPPE